MRKASRFVSLMMALIFSISITVIGLSSVWHDNVQAVTIDLSLIIDAKYNYVDDYCRYDASTRTFYINKSGLSFVSSSDFENLSIVIDSSDRDFEVEFNGIQIDNSAYPGRPCVCIGENSDNGIEAIFWGCDFKAGSGAAAIQIDSFGFSGIKITGGDVYATGGSGAAAIGTSENGKDVKSLVVSIAGLKATGGDGAAAIGSGKNSYIANLRISSCYSLEAHGGYHGAGIGAGENSKTSNIVIYNSKGNIYGGVGAAGIGLGFSSNNYDYKGYGYIEIDISDLKVQGGAFNSLVYDSCAGSGIGTGGYAYNEKVSVLPYVSSISIRNSKIEAVGGKGNPTQGCGAGIGGCNFGNIRIYDNCNIRAVGGGDSSGIYYPGAGIGSSSFGILGAVTIEDSYIDVVRGETYDNSIECDAIGAGYKSQVRPGVVRGIRGGHINILNSTQSLDDFAVDGGTFYMSNNNATDSEGKVLVPIDFGPYNVNYPITSIQYLHDYGYGNYLPKSYSLYNSAPIGEKYVFLPKNTPALVKVELHSFDSSVNRTILVAKGIPANISAVRSDGSKAVFYRDNQYTIKYYTNDVITENIILYDYKEGVTEPAKYHQTHVYKYVCTNNCEICGYSRSTGDNHVYDNPEDTTCNYCGHVREIVCSHNPVAIPDRAATCTVAGLKGKTVCSKCGEVINPGTVIPALSHNIITVGEKEPTCTEDGFTGKVICDKCDTVFHTGFAIPAKGHTKEVINQEPTCTKGTIKNRIQCSDCGILIDPGVIGPALGHSASTPNVIAPTCTKDGSSGDVVCSRCNEKLADATVIPKLGHDIVSGDKEATCTEDGYTGRYVCSRGDYLFDAGTVVKATGHNEVTTGYIAPTCTDNGFTGVTRCTKCNLVTSPNMYIAPTGHNYVVNIPYQAPTCTSAGHTESVWCSNCHDVKTYSTTIPATNHTPVTTGVNKDATCTTPGSTTGTKCSVCGYVIVAEKTIPAKGHTEVIDPAVPATSTTPGYTEGSHCSVCKTIIKAQQYIPPTAPVPTPGEEGGVEGFVERLYTVCLGRTSDPTGKADWVKALKDGAADGAKVANGFFFSPEFTNKNLSDDEYVDRLYRTFMDRPGDPDGVAAWVKALKGGATREQVFAGFINSIEWANICQKYGIKSGGSATPTEPKPVVNPTQPILDFTERLYTTCLGRNADPDGKAAWAKALANKEGTGSSVAHGFFFSKEFELAKHTDEEFVRRLYLTFMDREPDPAGFQAWVNAMKEDGASREQVFNGFVKSPEFVAICEKAGIIAY